jgi:hypothetical protein
MQVILWKTQPVSYCTYEAVALQNGSLIALIKLGRDYLLNKGLRAKLAILWTIIGSAFVLAVLVTGGGTDLLIQYLPWQEGKSWLFPRI